MTKRIFNWKHSKNKKYEGREHPNFDFFEGCKNGTVVWWNDRQYCLDMDKLKKLLDREGKMTCRMKLEYEPCYSPCCIWDVRLMKLKNSNRYYLKCVRCKKIFATVEMIWEGEK